MVLLDEGGILLCLVSVAAISAPLVQLGCAVDEEGVAAALEGHLAGTALPGGGGGAVALQNDQRLDGTGDGPHRRGDRDGAAVRCHGRYGRRSLIGEGPVVVPGDERH